jgi:hypothetical protein
MHERYAKSQLSITEPRHVNSNVIWALFCGALLFGGYFYGAHHQNHSPVVTSKLRFGTRGPAQADGTLPIAPNFGGNSASTDLLARAQLESELVYTDLKSFVCKERMDRYRRDGNKRRQIDTVNAQVSFENGMENYSDIREDDRLRASMSSIPGAWSEGEFGTLLRQTRALLSSQPIAAKGDTDLGGVPAALYAFDVAAEDSPWDLTVGSREYRVSFRTNVWVSKTSGQIMKIERNTTATPPASGISEIQWSVVLIPIDMDGRTWLLPSSGEYSVSYNNPNHREWNALSFSDYHRYASRSVIHF